MKNRILRRVFTRNGRIWQKKVSLCLAKRDIRSIICHFWGYLFVLLIDMETWTADWSGGGRNTRRV